MDAYANNHHATLHPNNGREPTPPPPTLDANTALDALAHAQGNPALAAERLNLQSADELLAILALDETIHPRAQAVLRFMQQAKLFGALQYAEDALLATLEHLEPKDLAKLYPALIQAAEVYTRNSSTPSSLNNNTTLNVTQNILRMVPPNVRAAIQVLTATDIDTAERLETNSA